jgi:hypothetical protein
MNTEQDDLTETLEAIARGSRRSKIVRLREIFDKVEVAKAQGASNKEIVAGLKKHGLIFDVNNFKNARSRILKERAMEALTRASPAVNESKPTCKPTKARNAVSTNVSVPNVADKTDRENVVKEIAVKHVAKSSGKRKSILNQDKGVFGDLDPPPADGIVNLKQK